MDGPMDQAAQQGATIKIMFRAKSKNCKKKYENFKTKNQCSKNALMDQAAQQGATIKIMFQANLEKL